MNHKQEMSPRKWDADPESIFMRSDYVIYTDGCCLKNPGGAGGWSAIILRKDKSRVISLRGGHPSTTNNRMEITGAIEGLKQVPPASKVAVITDSEYLKNGANLWAKAWAKKGFKNKKNPDLWQSIVTLMNERQCKFFWVRGHNGDQLNEECDTLAARAARKFRTIQPA